MELNLAGLVNIEDWQKIQDSFSDALEVTLSTVSLDGSLLTKTSRPSRICTEILPPSPDSVGFCGVCIRKNKMKNLMGTDKDVHFKCPFGLDAYVIPIKVVGNKVAAYIILGPVIAKARKDVSEYAKEAARMKVDLDRLMDALIEISVFSYNKIYSITNLLRDIFTHMAQTGYHKKRLGEIAPEVVEMDPLFSHYYEEKVLAALLNSCALALSADSGSVMIVDKKTNMLRIKVASKLDQDIIDKTKLKVGEGIAGLAAASAKPIILPKDEDKNGLSGKMHRTYIKSSMIVPFNKGNAPDVYGVINLNIVRKNINFSEKDIAIVKQLTNLASTCLAPFKQVSTQGVRR